MTSVAMYVPQSTNRKTGNIPQQVIGTTRAESLESCKGCALLDRAAGDDTPTCYAQFGTMAWAHAGMIRAAANGRDYSIENALAKRSRGAKAFRLGSLGEPSAMGAREYKRAYRLIRRAGLTVRSYTHFWHRKRNAWMRGLALASCNTPIDALTAVKAGWRAAAIVDRFAGMRDWFAAHGLRAAACPAQIDKRATCNHCRMCDPEFSGIDVVMLERH